MGEFISIPSFIIQLVILISILWVLNKFLFKPYLAFLDELAAKHEKLEKDYKNIETITLEAEVNCETILAEARDKGAQIIANSQAIGKQQREEIISKAESDAKDFIASAQSEIEKERMFMLSGIKSHIVDLVIRLNAQLFKQGNISKEFIEKNLESINK